MLPVAILQQSSGKTVKPQELTVHYRADIMTAVVRTCPHSAVSVHQTPGRLRLRVPAWKRNAWLCHSAERTAMALDGVFEATANPLTGSLTIRHNPAVGAETILNCLKTADVLSAVPPVAPAAPISPPGRAADKIIDAATDKIVEAIVGRSVAAVVAAIL